MSDVANIVIGFVGLALMAGTALVATRIGVRDAKRKMAKKDERDE